MELSLTEGIAPGVAYFDTRSDFPENHRCFALFLDWGNVLVLASLKNKSGSESEYHRIGIARFVWTPSQSERYRKRNDPPPPGWRGICYCGPISDQDERVVVKVV